MLNRYALGHVNHNKCWLEVGDVNKSNREICLLKQSDLFSFQAMGREWSLCEQEPAYWLQRKRWIVRTLLKQLNIFSSAFWNSLETSFKVTIEGIV